MIPLYIWKLRWKLWWLFFHAPSDRYRLFVRWVKSSAYPPGYWAYVLRVKTQSGPQEAAIGPVAQWNLQEALGMASRKAQWLLRPDLEPEWDDPGGPSGANPPRYPLGIFRHTYREAGGACEQCGFSQDNPVHT